MEIYNLDFKSIPKDLEKSVCAIGYFDGIHLGHQALIQEAVKIAKEKHLKAGIITFDPDPWVVFKPDLNLDHLMSMEDKEETVEKMGIEVFYILHFTRAFAALSPLEFSKLLESMHVKELVCGEDFHFASKNSGDVEFLKSQPYLQTHILDFINDNGKKISSSQIEPLIREGKVDEANRMLGSYYSIGGTIVHGYKRGSTLLGFPTANLEPSDHYVIPADGVYAGYTLVDNQLYPCMINIGNNPTFNNRQVTIEANIFDFHQNIYGKKARFFFVQKIRDGKKFSSIDELKEQLAHDREECLQLENKASLLYQKTKQDWLKTVNK